MEKSDGTRDIYQWEQQGDEKNIIQTLSDGRVIDWKSSAEPWYEDALSGGWQNKYNWYIVKEGDSLWSIAERELGAGARYEELYRKNRCVIGENYDQLYPGMRLKIEKRENRQRVQCIFRNGGLYGKKFKLGGFRNRCDRK